MADKVSIRQVVVCAVENIPKCQESPQLTVVECTYTVFESFTHDSHLDRRGD